MLGINPLIQAQYLLLLTLSLYEKAR